MLHVCNGRVDPERNLMSRFMVAGEIIRHRFTRLSCCMKFVLLINLKLLTIANSFLLNIAEHENFSANKYKNTNSILSMKISLLINMKIPTTVGIFMFISRENFMLS